MKINEKRNYENSNLSTESMCIGIIKSSKKIGNNKFKIVIVCILSVLLFTGCASSNEVKELRNQVSQLKTEVDKIKELSSETISNVSPQETETNETPAPQSNESLKENSSISSTVTDMSDDEIILYAKSSNDQNAELLIQVMNTKKSLSVAVQSALASCPNWRVRRAIAQNPIVCDEVICILIKDRDDDVSSVVFNIARSRNNLLKETQVALAKSSNWAIRKAIAQNPIICDEAIRFLINDRDDDVLSAVFNIARSRNNLLKETQVALAKSNNWAIRKAIAQNPIICDEAICILIKDRDSDVLSAVTNIAHSRNNLLKETQISLANSSNWILRRAIAQNPTVSTDILERLINDSDSDVRNSAKVALSEKIKKGETVIIR